MISTNSPGYNHSKGTTAGIIGTTGIAAQLASIPFFIAAAKNRRKAIAANAFFKMERAPVIQKAGFISQNFPAIALKFSL